METSPKEGATCSLENDKGKWFVNKTPGTVVVHRSYKDLDVKCQEEGCAPSEEKVKSKVKPMAAGNIIFGGLVGAGVDAVDGAAYDYPTDIKVNMADEQKSKSDSTN